jgi:hypothetical protein
LLTLDLSDILIGSVRLEGQDDVDFALVVDI